MEREILRMNITLKEDFLPLTPHAFHVLLAIAERPMYANGVFEQCQIDAFGSVNFSRRSVYRTIKQLYKAHFITGSSKSFGGGTYFLRQYYEITSTGIYVLEQEARRYKDVIRIADRRLTHLGVSHSHLGPSPVEIFY
jgi:DNA-binding PadR family transcriptional regulator